MDEIASALDDLVRRGTIEAHMARAVLASVRRVVADLLQSGADPEIVGEMIDNAVAELRGQAPLKVSPH